MHGKEIGSNDKTPVVLKCDDSFRDFMLLLLVSHSWLCDDAFWDVSRYVTSCLVACHIMQRLCNVHDTSGCVTIPWYTVVLHHVPLAASVFFS